MLAPDVGFFSEQADVMTYHCGDVDGLGISAYNPDVGSIKDALMSYVIDHPPVSTDRDERMGQRRQISSAHEEVYTQVLHAA